MTRATSMFFQQIHLIQRSHPPPHDADCDRPILTYDPEHALLHTRRSARSGLCFTHTTPGDGASHPTQESRITHSALQFRKKLMFATVAAGHITFVVFNTLIEYVSAPCGDSRKHERQQTNRDPRQSDLLKHTIVLVFK